MKNKMIIGSAAGFIIACIAAFLLWPTPGSLVSGRVADVQTIVVVKQFDNERRDLIELDAQLLFVALSDANTERAKNNHNLPNDHRDIPYTIEVTYSNGGRDRIDSSEELQFMYRYSNSGYIICRDIEDIVALIETYF